MDGERFELLVVLTNNILKSIQRLKMSKMRLYDLTGAHTNCICRLERAGAEGMTQLELVQQEMMDASQISRVLRELMDKKYVKVDGEDGRYRRRYSLTETGLEIAKEIRDMISEISGFVMQGISMEEREVFYQALNRISGRLSEAEGIFCCPEKN